MSIAYAVLFSCLSGASAKSVIPQHQWHLAVMAFVITASVNNPNDMDLLPKHSDWGPCLDLNSQRFW